MSHLKKFVPWLPTRVACSHLFEQVAETIAGLPPNTFMATRVSRISTQRSPLRHKIRLTVYTFHRFPRHQCGILAVW